jgi:general secretion pathway protein I
MSSRRSSEGFSLLEVLVAFAILALSLGVLMQLFSGGMRSALIGSSYSRAVDLAESTLALVGTEIPLQPGSQAGEEKGLRWELNIQPYVPEGLLAPPQDIQAFQVSVRVTWEGSGSGRSISLDTLHLAEVRP